MLTPLICLLSGGVGGPGFEPRVFSRGLPSHDMYGCQQQKGLDPRIPQKVFFLEVLFVFEKFSGEKKIFQKFFVFNLYEVI